ncbi:hypothetical protein [Phormidesmis priestleyi]|uniref:hypothetical protein n=1 Tax=Phormidesmis priestleyi TaxID=268141 RepID=UPI00083AF857|nr:hypothetical protein [Phormidesmis priestleyi]
MINSAEEYLKRTESAASRIFDGISSYIEILRDAPKPTFSGSFDGSETRKQAFDSWAANNEEAIKLSLKAQREFSAESFALATLCGSLLQIAYMGIQWFSENQEIPDNLPKDLHSLLKPKTKPAKFCIGRKIRSIPIGLIIYAGRNQSNHMEDEKLHGLNATVFNLLASNHCDTASTFKDPAFDLENETLINFSSNITALLDWSDYKSYCRDMHALIVAV